MVHLGQGWVTDTIGVCGVVRERRAQRTGEEVIEEILRGAAIDGVAIFEGDPGGNSIGCDCQMPSPFASVMA